MLTKPQKILILDDEPDTIEVLKLAFQRSPFEIVFETSGCMAVAKIFEAYANDEPFDALVMDCALPRLDGFSIARFVRQAEKLGLSKRTKIGYFTAFAKTVDQSTLLEEVGAQAYWRKPEDSGNLPALITLWLNEGGR